MGGGWGGVGWVSYPEAILILGGPARQQNNQGASTSRENERLHCWPDCSVLFFKPILKNLSFYSKINQFLPKQLRKIHNKNSCDLSLCTERHERNVNLKRCLLRPNTDLYLLYAMPEF